jgi:hypothetical protein
VKKTRQKKKSVRCDVPRRVTPELMAFYKRRAKQLRDEAYRDVARSLWALLAKIIGRR